MFLMVSGIAAAAGSAAWLGQQTHSLVRTDGLDIDADTLGKSGDRGGGKGWHGAGVAFDVTINTSRTGRQLHPRTHVAPRKARLCISAPICTCSCFNVPQHSSRRW